MDRGPSMMPARVLTILAALCVLLPRTAAAQGLTGTLIGTVKDQQGGVLPGALTTISSPALIGGPQTVAATENGQVRFQALPPGHYVVEVSMPGFASYRED